MACPFSFDMVGQLLDGSGWAGLALPRRQWVRPKFFFTMLRSRLVLKKVCNLGEDSVVGDGDVATVVVNGAEFVQGGCGTTVERSYSSLKARGRV
jgi:hypothetical protein